MNNEDARVRPILERGLSIRLGSGARFRLEPVVELAGQPPAAVRLEARPFPPAAEGPVREASRRTLALRLDDGYLGDGLLELSSLADGTASLGIGLRLLPTNVAGPVRQVGMRLAPPSGFGPTAASTGTIPSGQFAMRAGGGWLVFGSGSGDEFLGVLWWPDGDGWLDRLGGEGLWARVGDGSLPPFYQAWESHLRQWGGPSGWTARESSQATLGPEGLDLAWHAGGDLPVDGALNFSGALALAWADSEAEVRRRLEALISPLKPTAEGAELVGFDRLDGSYRFRRTGRSCAISFPADQLGRSALVRIDGAPAGAVRCAVDGAPARPQLVSVGRTDDPNAPDDGRPDGNGRPVLAAEERPAGRVELAVRLSPDRPTRIEAAEAEGLSLSYLAQDDRRELLLFSSREERPLGRLSLHDLRLRDLRPPGMARPAAACLPLYWYRMNAPSPWQSANRLEGWELLENGPGAVRLRLSAANPDGAARSTFEVAVALSAAGALVFDVAARLEIAGRFPEPHLQFLNLFPEGGRTPGAWTHDETLAAFPGFLRAVDNREGAAGLKRVEVRAPFFLAQYPAQRGGDGKAAGNLALLVTDFRPKGTPLAYELCRCWLDNHLYAVFPEGGPRAGSVYEARYRLAAWPDRGEGRAGREEMARRALAGGELRV